MRRQNSVDSLWDRLESTIRTSLKTRPVPLVQTMGEEKHGLLPPLCRSPSKSTKAATAPHRMRSFQLTEDEPKYGIPIEKYSTLLMTDRQYQAHILTNEFSLLSERLKLCSEALELKSKERFALLGREEQIDFNGRLEKTIAWLQEVLEIMTYKNKRLLRAGIRPGKLPEDNYVLCEPDMYADNLKLFLECSSLLLLLHEEYSRMFRYNRQLTLSLEQCTVVLKRLSQLRLSLSYILEEVSAHEESIRFDRRMLKSLSGVSSLSGLIGEKLKAFKEANIDINVAKKPKCVNPLTLNAKEFALHLIEQKSHSTRYIAEKRVDSPQPKSEKPPLDDKYSNLSHLYMEEVWKKGVNLKKPSTKYRLVRESRAARVLDRALNSKNQQVANSVRMLISERPLRTTIN